MMYNGFNVINVAFGYIFPVFIKLTMIKHLNIFCATSAMLTDTSFSYTVFTVYNKITFHLHSTLWLYHQYHIHSKIINHIIFILPSTLKLSLDVVNATFCGGLKYIIIFLI